MKKTTLTSLATFVLAYGLFASQASAFSLSFGNDDQGLFFEKFVSSLFQNSNKIGAALIGEVTSVDISSSTSFFTLSSKQKVYSIAISADTKVRKLGIPGEIEDIKAGDKVSVVSSVSKTETPKLRARVVSILSQAGEGKYKVASTTDVIGTTIGGATTPPVTSPERPVTPPERDETSQKESKEIKEVKEIKEKEGKELPLLRIR